MIFQLEGLVERTISEKKSLSDYVNNYQGMQSKPFTQEIYNKVVEYLTCKYLIGLSTSTPLAGVCLVFTGIAYEKQSTIAGFLSIAGLGIFASYALISLVRLVELQSNEDEIKEQSREIAQKKIKEKLGIKR